MSMFATLSRPKKDTSFSNSDVGEPFEPIHLVCHCTNEELAFCGTGLAKDAEYYPDSDDAEDCVMCVTESQLSGNKCPWGCSCSKCVAFSS